MSDALYVGLPWHYHREYRTIYGGQQLPAGGHAGDPVVHCILNGLESKVHQQGCCVRGCIDEHLMLHVAGPGSGSVLSCQRIACAQQGL